MQSKVKDGRIPVFKKRFGELAKRYETRAAFADALGLSRQSVNFWLNGERVPDAENLISVCSKLGVSSDWLLGLSEIPSRNEDMQTAHLLTGLSEQALSNVAALSENPNFLTGLEYILTVDASKLADLTAQITRYLKSLAYLAANKEEIDMTIPLKDGHDVLSFRDSAKFRRKLAVEIFTDMIRVEEDS